MKRTRVAHETLSDLRSRRPVLWRPAAVVRDHVGVGVLDRDRPGGGRQVLRDLRLDAAIQLSVRRRAVADDRRDRRHPVSPAAHPLRDPDVDHRCHQLCGDGIALWLARSGFGRAPVRALWAGRLRARDTGVLARAQIRRQAGAGAFESRDKLTRWPRPASPWRSRGKSLPICGNRLSSEKFT
jgi:hypothetical protein